MKFKSFTANLIIITFLLIGVMKGSINRQDQVKAGLDLYYINGNVSENSLFLSPKEYDLNLSCSGVSFGGYFDYPLLSQISIKLCVGYSSLSINGGTSKFIGYGESNNEIIEVYNEFSLLSKRSVLNLIPSINYIPFQEFPMSISAIFDFGLESNKISEFIMFLNSKSVNSGIQYKNHSSNESLILSIIPKDNSTVLNYGLGLCYLLDLSRNFSLTFNAQYLVNNFSFSQNSEHLVKAGVSISYRFGNVKADSMVVPLPPPDLPFPYPPLPIIQKLNECYYVTFKKSFNVEFLEDLRIKLENVGIKSEIIEIGTNVNTKNATKNFRLTSVVYSSLQEIILTQRTISDFSSKNKIDLDFFVNSVNCK